MDQDDQFHSFWNEPSQIVDPTSSFFIPEIPKLPFEEQVQSPIIHELSDGFQLSPTLIPMSSAPISTAAYQSFNSCDPEFEKEFDSFYSMKKCSSSQSSFGSNLNSMNANYIFQNNSQADPNISINKSVSQQKIKQSKKIKLNQSIPNDSMNSNIICSSQTKNFFENLAKVLDKPLTKEQIAFISNILPRNENQNSNSPVSTNAINNSINIQPKKSFNISLYSQRIRNANSYSNNLGMNEDVDFNLNCEESEFVINPQKLGFIPPNSWMDKEMTFGYLVTSFFQKRNNASSRFSHKLYNALRLSSAYPNLVPYIGVEWITPTILKVNKFTFARLLRIKTIDGSLFHQQGNFPSHGFVELTEKESHELLTPEQLEDVDYESVRLLKHPAGIFTKDCTGTDIANCKWINSRRRQ